MGNELPKLGMLPFPTTEIVALDGCDISTYAALLARQLDSNVAISNRYLLGVRWLLSPLADISVPSGKPPEFDGIAGSLLFITGSLNYVSIGGYAIDSSIDTIRLAARHANLREKTLAYAQPKRALRYLCPSDPLKATIAAIRGRAMREEQSALLPGANYAEFVVAVARHLGLPKLPIEAWFRRQLRLLSAAQTYFDDLFQSQRPEAVLCHGGLNFITGGAKLAAARASIPLLEIQHGAISMIDPARSRPALTPYVSELLLAWLKHSDDANEVVIGPPTHRLHEWLVNDGDPMRDYLPTPLRDAYRKALVTARTVAPPSGKPVILIAQQSAGHELRRMQEAGLDLSAAHVWIRTHPRAGRALNSSSTFEPNSLPLGVLLDRADWVLSGHSSVAVEAAAFGCGVMFLSPDGPRLYPGIESHADEIAALPAPLRKRFVPQPQPPGWLAELKGRGWTKDLPRRDSV